MKICSIENCSKKVYAKTFCKSHYEKNLKYGDPLFIVPRFNHARGCKVDGCDGKYQSKGYCGKHNARLLRYGSVDIVKAVRHGKKWTSEYFAWCSMKQRCTNPKDKGYPRYGGRGIKVCDRWMNSFMNFLEDMGEKPFPEYQIDRSDNDLGYSPDNCKWVTPSVNSLNRCTSLKNRK